MFGASISETAMRPNPSVTLREVELQELPVAGDNLGELLLA
jgi:hypothetical protein